MIISTYGPYGWFVIMYHFLHRFASLVLVFIHGFPHSFANVFGFPSPVSKKCWTLETRFKNNFGLSAMTNRKQNPHKSSPFPFFSPKDSYFLKMLKMLVKIHIRKKTVKRSCYDNPVQSQDLWKKLQSHKTNIKKDPRLPWPQRGHGTTTSRARSWRGPTWQWPQRSARALVPPKPKEETPRCWLLLPGVP